MKDIGKLQSSTSQVTEDLPVANCFPQSVLHISLTLALEEPQGVILFGIYMSLFL